MVARRFPGIVTFVVGLMGYLPVRQKEKKKKRHQQF